MAAQAERFEDFTGLIGALSKEIQRIKAAEGAKLGLKGSDVMCLYYLGLHPEGLTGAQLAREADVTRAAVSRTLAHLEEEGLVEVGESADASASYRAPARLTEKGRSRMSEVDRVIARVLVKAGAALSDDERALMYDALARVLAALKDVARGAPR